MPACVSTAATIPLLSRPNSSINESNQLRQMSCSLRESKLQHGRVERPRRSERRYVDLTIQGVVSFTSSLAWWCSPNRHVDFLILRLIPGIKCAFKNSPRIICHAYLAAAL
jgi:hypothetical protein